MPTPIANRDDYLEIRNSVVELKTRLESLLNLAMQSRGTCEKIKSENEIQRVYIANIAPLGK